VSHDNGALANLAAQVQRGVGLAAVSFRSIPMDDNGRGSLSGLTEKEAQEFHSIFIKSFVGFTLVAIVAHILVWQWRPWL
jgi:light-harvesting complex 1 beta chain